MSRPNTSQGKDVSSSQELEPPNRPDKLIPLIGLDNLFNFRLDDRDIYEDVLEALREGRDYKDWAWWPYLVFPIPEELYPTDKPNPSEKGKFITRKYLPHMVTLLQIPRWGTRLGYAVKLLGKLGKEGITKIIEGAPGEEFQKERRFHLGRFLLTYNSVLAMPGYEENNEARKVCLRLLKPEEPWVDHDELVKTFISDQWGDEMDLSSGKVIGPADFENKKGWRARGEQGGTSYFSQGMQRAAEGLPLQVDDFAYSMDWLRERMGGKGNQFHISSPLDKEERLSNHDDVSGARTEVRAKSHPIHERRIRTSAIYDPYIPRSSISTKRQPATADHYDHGYERHGYEEVHNPERDRVSSSRHHYAHPTSTRDRYQSESSSSRSRGAQPAPASWGDVLPEHVREISDKYRRDHGLPEGEYYVSKHRR